MIIQTLETLESLKWSVAISKVIHMLLLQSLIMAVLSVSQYNANLENPRWRATSNFPPFLLSIKQQFSNCVWRRSFSLMLFIEPGQLAGCPSINKLTGTLEKSWLFHGKQLCRPIHLPRGKLSSLLFSSKFNTTIGTFYIEVNIKWMESFFLVRAQSERFQGAS